jgi:polyhydroxybutyrate depolymerase
VKPRTATSRRVLTATVVVATLALAACSSSGSHANARLSSVPTTARATTTTTRPLSSGCGKPATPKAGITDHTLRVGGTERVYQLDVPASYDGHTPFAIVLGLHALTVNYKFIPSMTGFDLGERYHFIGVNPSGRFTHNVPYWNAAPVTKNEDVAYISALLDHLEAAFCVDTTKVFSTGMSNGAQMSSLLACTMPNRIAAIAPVSGEEWLPPCTGRPVPIIAFHGTADPILPYTGGGLNATHIAQIYRYGGHLPRGLPAPLGIDASMRAWAAHNGCNPTPTERRIKPHIRLRTWSGCTAPTELYIVDGGGHSWPGEPEPAFEATMGKGTTEINATDLIYQFFFRRQ